MRTDKLCYFFSVNDMNIISVLLRTEILVSNFRVDILLTPLTHYLGLINQDYVCVVTSQHLSINKNYVYIVSGVLNSLKFCSVFTLAYRISTCRLNPESEKCYYKSWEVIRIILVYC